MVKQLVNVLVAVVLLHTSGAAMAGESTPDPSCPWSGDQGLAALLTTVRSTHDVPAMAGAIVTSRGLVTAAAVGVRRRDAAVAVTLTDTWHLGSITKAMTSALIAHGVEQGHLTWDTTVAHVFPESSRQFDPAMRSVTVLQLLSHRAGLPKDLDLDEYRGDCGPRERVRAVKRELAKPPDTQPGSQCLYSNLGYIVAGAMIEKLTGDAWEKSMTDHVFGPLEMEHAGFGGAGTPGKIDQPWGHDKHGDPVAGNGPSVDNPPVMGPAGRVHCTIQAWAGFVADQLRGARGEPSMLQASSYRTLHTPHFAGEYALGWIRTRRDWAGGAALHHAGSNTMNYANVWMSPERDFAVLVCVNQGGDAAFNASDAAASAMIDYHAGSIAKHDRR